MLQETTHSLEHENNYKIVLFVHFMDFHTKIGLKLLEIFRC